MYVILGLLGMIAVLAMPAFAETPSEQMKKGTPLDEISCSTGMTLIESPTGRLACVFESTVERMEQRGWEIIDIISSVADSEKDDEPKDDVAAAVADGAKDDESKDDESKDDVSTPVADNEKDDEPKDDVPVATADMPHKTSDTDIPAIAPDDKSALGENTIDNENDKDDSKYLILGGRINLKSLETGPIVDPNPINFPLTLEEAEAAMQRLADGFDDRVIYPPVLEDYRVFVYDTELGNTFELRWESVLVDGEWIYTGMVQTLYYDVYSHNQYGKGYTLDTGARDFFKTAMEKSGFTVSSIHASGHTIQIYGNGGSLSGSDWIDYYDRPVMRLRLDGWENTLPPVIPEDVALDTAKAFFANHKHLLDPEKCDFKEYSKILNSRNAKEPYIRVLGWVYNESIQTNIHVPAYGVNMGRCENPIDHRVKPYGDVQVIVDAVDGKVAWFKYIDGGGANVASFLIDGWEDMVYIPPHVRSNS